ncbi:MAG TPA: gliding motility-associated C-terminal domain-containing protein [Flavobacteriales bacterium]|nr:gliding motility-associated C-terminal domain-containing protein [Flavobacteriales bacterium]
MKVFLYSLLYCLPLFSAAADPAPADGGPFRNTFLANEGQWPGAILYKGRSSTANVSFLRDGLSFSQVEPEAEEEDHEEEHIDHHAEPNFIVWNMRFEGMEPSASVIPVNGRPSVLNYLSGGEHPISVVHPMECEQLVYRGMYPGIDVEFRMNGYDLEYDYRVQAGADIARIRNSYAGIERLYLTTAGDLVVVTTMGEQIQRAPISWQMIEGKKHAVDVGFILLNDSTFGFTVRGEYDRTHELVIDPLFEMVWASYTRILGGSNNMNYAFANAMDAQGNVYMTGFVDGTFPVTPGAYSGPGNVYGEVFVAKFSSDGTTLLYSTYLPANSAEFGASIAVDALGRAYVTGLVNLNFTGITDFPSTPNAYQPVCAAGGDAFLTVLDPTGSSLVYSTFIGGSGGETGYSLALGPTGIAYVTGTTSIGDLQEVAATNYPTGDGDLFVAKFDIAQVGAASLIYLVRIGAGNFGYCKSHGIAVDDAGNAYVTGSVQMSFGPSLFPVTPGAFDTTFGTGDEGAIGYLLKLGNTLPVSIVYATYLGPGEAASVATFGGDAFVIGTTFNATFPTTANALQPTYGGSNTDAFALRMNATGTALIYSTFLGGDGQDQGTDIVVNDAGEAFAAGISRGGFPTSTGGYQPVNAGTFTNDIFLVQLNSSGTDYGCGGSTYVGGSQDEYYGSFYEFYAPSIALLNVGGQDVVSVAATSHSEDFPTTPGVYEENKVNGIADQPVFFKLSCATELVAAPTAGFDATVLPTCTGAFVDFEDTSTNTAQTWSWSFPGGSPPTSSAQDPQDIVYNDPGIYSVTLVACNAIGCDTLVQSITVAPPIAIVVDLGNDTTACAGASITLSPGPDFDSYIWQQDGSVLPTSAASIVANSAGVYSVAVTGAGGCPGVDTVQVIFVDAPQAAFTYALEGVCRSDHVLFVAAPVGASYAWSLGDGTQATGLTVEHAYLAPGTYTVALVVSNGGCSNSIVQQVEISSSGAPIPDAVIVPNVITPNGDGANDCFAPIGYEDSPECFDVQIFNRWGQELFHGQGSKSCWTGDDMNGQQVPDGVYYYVLTVDRTEYHGNVQLLR